MPDHDELETLQTIGAFARRVGMTPSALRFYDECGLLVPAVVDAGSGYRRYADDQLGRAMLLRRLREARLPLAAAPAVLDGDPAEAVHVLREHLRRLARDYDPARSATTGLLGDLVRGVGSPARLTRVLLAGTDLARAVRHVAPAAAPPTPELDDGYRGLRCVRLEVTAEEVTLVASDRVQMSLRTLVPVEGEGPDVAVCVATDELEQVATWAATRHEVAVCLDGSGTPVVLTADDEERTARVVPVPYPDWRAVLGRVGRPRARAVVDRRRLLDEVLARDERPVVVDVAPGRSRVTVARPGGPPVDVLGTCTGASVVAAFDPSVLAAALRSGLGPDVVLELVDPRQAVVVRSADVGTATTLVMPLGVVPEVADDEDAGAPPDAAVGRSPAPVEHRA